MCRKINLNSFVKVKLTKIGLEELKRQHDKLYESLPASMRVEFNPPDTDNDGYSSFQLWILMGQLGHLCKIGCVLPFKTEILLEGEDD